EHVRARSRMSTADRRRAAVTRGDRSARRRRRRTALRPRAQPQGEVMNHDLQLAYLGIEVPEPDRLSSFFGEVIGLVPGERVGDGAITWRNDDKAHRVIVTPGPANDVAFVGFEAANADVFAATVERLGAAGFAASDPADAAARRVEQITRLHAPWGTTVEIVTGLAAAASPYASASMPGGFL